MADLTATMWTYGATSVVIGNKRRYVDVTLTLASGNAAVYPLSGGVGIPLSTNPGDYGMVRNMDYIMIYDSGSNVATQTGRLYKYVASGPGIKIYANAASTAAAGAVFAEMASTVAPANVDGLVIKGMAVGW